MFETIKKVLGIKTTDYAQLIKEGAVIVDVRSPGEFRGGHIQGSMNIPVDQLAHSLPRLKDKNKPIITCCASGMRSASAKAILQSNGYVNVYNGGSWHGLKAKIK